MSKYTNDFFLFYSLFLSDFQSRAQTTTITGVVTDSITEAPLSFISVFLGWNDDGCE